MASNEELVMQIKAGDESQLLELWRAADGGSLRFRHSVTKSTAYRHGAPGATSWS